ncbi:hypothetical protein [Ketogulonicigenium vulgare]|uniref:Uncharacterized protein n=1 Tax=Ketogulonicigenium vulgare (strain WSH-001) TaxID=759362 RepID=F9Y620_KETVW|nr:hypothetical protein [Ketogulonicigenium vulgare]ADO42653.1 conserved hypothetical protein [Ketogulonicigenium vulgare Y25]AEM40845.1 hypothetical protein KVU_1005 [Ketogulonicigenium vulgare WSH-001]ALJ81008.1 hypothetical protein KVH_07330 [Ketogulonicigenium vulgare]ANW35020.1 hypothetical protein KvSKV_07300 [Ketogulonicigenium vulgare]AOZ54563.1 hypothetical protein KVC_1549 [Ketogulonicigenium vulgare]
MTRLISTLALCALIPFAASAATEEAWDQFRADVQTACAALAPEDGQILVEVNPFGSEKYGAAIVYQQTDAGLDRYVCIYDKQAQTAEITLAFPAAGN